MLLKLADFFQVSTDTLLGIKEEETISVEGLTAKQIAHLKLLISDLKEKN